MYHLLVELYTTGYKHTYIQLCVHVHEQDCAECVNVHDCTDACTVVCTCTCTGSTAMCN